MAAAPTGRLRRRGEYQRVYANGIKVVGRFLVLFFRVGEGVACRYGITVTRRTGGAVVRNRVRRRLRELVRQAAESGDGWPGELVINVRRGVVEASWQELVEDFAGCLGRARRRLWRADSR